MIFVFIFLLVAVLLYLYWQRRLRTNRYYPVLAYHKVTDRFEWGITRVTPKSFEQQVRHLREEGFSSKDLDDLFKAQEENGKKVALTFDDGYESVYKNVFPILKQHGLSATIFLVSGYIGKENLWEANFGRRFKHLSWEQILEMKDSGFQFGSHTVNHPDLTRLRKKDLEFELRKSKEMIEDKLNQELRFLSYPFGRHNPPVREEAKKAGYKAAFSLGSETSHDPFAIGRIGIYFFDTPLSLKIKLNPGGLFWIEDLKGWIINQFASGTVLVKRYKSQK